MASLNLINPRADLARAQFALQINTAAARGLHDVLAPNFGPRGTLKMLVSGGGDIKITKDGSVLLAEMQIQHPTAALISRVTNAQDDAVGDGTTSTVLIVGELLKQAEILISEGMHPRLIAQGYALARTKSIEILTKLVIPLSQIISTDPAVAAKKDSDPAIYDSADFPRQTLINIARSSLCTKLRPNMVRLLSEIVVDAIGALKSKSTGPVDLHMVEIMEIAHKQDTDTRLIRGLVMDHGARHPQMPKVVKNAHIFICNVSFEYDKTEINSGYFYKTAEERLAMVAGERKFTDDRVKKVIELKNRVCKDGEGFVVITQKGIDPMSLAMFAEAGILALRRAKRRNMERLVLACGGVALNSLEDLEPSCLGKAGNVSEFALGEEKFTFVQEVPHQGSVTILINGPTRHCLTQIKDAIRDGLRAVNNCLNDGGYIPGAGAIEIALREELMAYSKTISGKEQLGVVAFSNALLVIVRTLVKNAGLDPQDVVVKLIAEYNKSKKPVGVDLNTGKPIDPIAAGILDNLIVKKQILIGATSIASNLLLVDEIIRAGVSTMKNQQG